MWAAAHGTQTARRGPCLLAALAVLAVLALTAQAADAAVLSDFGARENPS
jgi:hypothetical protein